MTETIVATALHVTVEQAVLTKALAIVERVVPSKSPLSVLAGIVLEAKSGKLTLRASDLETEISAIVEADMVAEGRACLLASQLTDFVKALPGGYVVLESEGMNCRVSGTGAKGKVVGFNYEDFPQPRTDADGPMLRLTVSQVKALFAATLYALEPPNMITRPAMNGVRLDGSESGLDAAGADGFSLGTLHLDVEITTPFGCTIAQGAVRLIKTIADGHEDDEPVEVIIGKATASFVFPRVTVVGRLVEGQYPDYRRIIPQGGTTTVTVAPSALRQAIALVSPFCGPGENRVFLTFDPEAPAIVEGKDPNGNGDGRAEVPSVETIGESVTFAVNRSYLREMLTSFGDAPVEMLITAPLLPVLMRREGQIGVVMPMQSR